MENYIFFSYSHKDKSFLEFYENSLSKLGYKVIYDINMSAGDLWDNKAKNFIRSEECKCIIVLISDYSSISKAVLTELEYIKRYGKKYFAILLDGESLQEKFKRMNSSKQYSHEELDIIDAMLDYFPQEMLYIKHNSNSIDLVKKALETIPVLHKRNYDLNSYKNSTEENIDMQFSIIQGKDVTLKDIEDALELDRRFYDFEEENFFTIDKCLKWYKTNPNIYTMLKDNHRDKIVAYINAAPITDECYEEIRSGKIIDAKINYEDIESFDMPGFYNLYFASVVVDLDYQNLFLLSKVYNAFADKLLKLADNDFIITRVLADAVSKKGKKFCEIFGMNKVVPQTDHESAIYEAILLPPQIRITSKKTRLMYESLLNKSKELGYSIKD